MQGFTTSLRGTVIQPRDAGYNTARKVWNGIIDRRPTLIAQCADADDVVRAITFAQRQGLQVSVRGGGHNTPGFRCAMAA